jgi:acyl carrier protein
MNDVANRVRQIIAGHLGVDETAIESETQFSSDLGADSLDIAELMIAFEDAFDVEIQKTDAQEIRTMQDVTRFIEKSYRPID